MRRATIWAVPALLVAGAVWAGDSLGGGGLYGVIEYAASWAGTATSNLNMSGYTVSDSAGSLTLNDNVAVTGTLDAQGAISNSTGDLTISDNVSISGLLQTPCASLTMAAAATEIDATADNCIVVTADGGGNTVATILGGSGQLLLLKFAGTGIVVTDTDGATGDTVNLKGASLDLRSTGGTTLALLHDGTKFFEVGRSRAELGAAHVYVSTSGDVTISASSTWYSVSGGAIAYTSTHADGWTWSAPELTIAAGAGGWYRVSYSISYSCSAGTATVQTGIAIDDNEGSPTFTEQAQCRTERTISSTAIGVVAATCDVLITGDSGNRDSLHVRVNNTANTNNLTINQLTLNVERL